MTEDTFDDNVSAVILLDVGSDILGIFKRDFDPNPINCIGGMMSWWVASCDNQKP